MMREKVILEDVCDSAEEQPSRAAPMAAMTCRDNMDITPRVPAPIQAVRDDLRRERSGLESGMSMRTLSP